MTIKNWQSAWRLPAFTLIECLIALAVLGLCMLLVGPVIQSSQRNQIYLASYQDQEFEVAMVQLQEEMKGLTFYNAASSTFYYKDANGKQAEFRVVNNVFAKTLNTGHQPLVMSVQGIRVTRQTQSLLIRFTFLDGKVRYGKVLIAPPKNQS